MLSAGDNISPSVRGGGQGGNTPAVVFKPSHYTRGKDGAPSEISPPLSADADKGDQDPIVFQPRYARNGRGAPDTIAGPLTAEAGRTGKGDSAQCVAYSIMPMNSGKDYKAREVEVAQPVMAGGPVGGNQGGDFVVTAFAQNMQVRRLTPVECERLQGFPDNYTAIPYRGKPEGQCPDGPRYKALGNSMAVPVMAWIGQRIQAAEVISKAHRRAKV